MAFCYVRSTAPLRTIGKALARQVSYQGKLVSFKKKKSLILFPAPGMLGAMKLYQLGLILSSYLELGHGDKEVLITDYDDLFETEIVEVQLCEENVYIKIGLQHPSRS